jgi:hypothetical protein
MGFVEIRDMFGKQTAQIGINETGGGVFPKSVRQFEAAWQGKGFAFGRYQATLSLVYGEEGMQTVTSVLSFWVLPVKPIALFLGGLTGLLLAIFVSVKLYIRRKLRGTLVATGKVLQAVPMQKLKPSSFSRLVAASSLMLGITIVLLLALFFFFS